MINFAALKEKTKFEMTLKNMRRYAAMVCVALILNVPTFAQTSAKGSNATAKTEVKADVPNHKNSADTTSTSAIADTAASNMLDDAALEMADTTTVDDMAEGGLYTQLKNKFVDGGVFFMSLIALTLILGLACCIERIIYLSMSEIDAKNFMRKLEEELKTKGTDAAKSLCRNTRGPVASICYQGLLRIGCSIDEIERSVNSYASVQVGNMEKGSSWITLFIAMAPSLGFLGTVIGMVMSFDQIEIAGDISPTIVAGGMKVALITTIFGIITALILQLFYNYMLSKIDHLTAQMEESAITLMDILKSYNDEKSK